MPSLRHLMPGLLLAAVLLSIAGRPAVAQERFVPQERGPRLLVLGGHSFWPSDPVCIPPYEGLVSSAMVAVQLPVSERLGLRIGGTFSGSARPWPPPPTGFENPIRRSGFALSGTVDLVAPIPVGAITLAPFVGGGVSVLQAGEFEEGDAEREQPVLILQQNVAPVAGFGAGLRYPLTRALSLEVIARRSTLFVGEQGYESAEGQEIEAEVGTLYATEVFVGLSFRL